MRKYVQVTTMVCILLSLTGCFRASTPSEFYQISPTLPPPCSSASDRQAEAIIGVGPVSVPSYLNRSSIVSRGADSAITVHNFDFWIEPISDAFVRTLTEEISAGTDAICLTAVPWTGGRRFDYQLVADLIRLDCSPAQSCTLEARWYLRSKGRETVIAPQVFSSSIDLPGTLMGREAIPDEVRGLEELTKQFSEATFAEIMSYLTAPDTI